MYHDIMMMFEFVGVGEEFHAYKDSAWCGWTGY